MPFLEANTTTFMKELWKLLVSASTSIGGIPREFIEARKRDILAAQGDQQRLIQDMDANAAAVQEHGYHALQPLTALPPRPHHTPAQFDPVDRSARDRYAAPLQQPQQHASRLGRTTRQIRPGGPRPRRPGAAATSRAPHAIAVGVLALHRGMPDAGPLSSSPLAPSSAPWGSRVGLGGRRRRGVSAAGTSSVKQSEEDQNEIAAQAQCIDRAIATCTRNAWAIAAHDGKLDEAIACLRYGYDAVECLHLPDHASRSV
ncbi:hypothetical protein AMAG_18194 [Allomyces macrogynus ATCC 38327]|uniref:PWI domain-containing protein n=1 Tax=Allomyces macrogynus (strain ATCC 38327) TaxID=578462 RepID=A0A0L0SAL8_ALLM3|nr:hypothetical protein AMAG_18194 [Allomyces macrogynus ATCC 38327]|eukprot:KNE59521.1 hypothetical protein AMAG_18194 [Allomyces macrogynus ATCC 38327]